MAAEVACDEIPRSPRGRARAGRPTAGVRQPAGRAGPGAAARRRAGGLRGGAGTEGRHSISSWSASSASLVTKSSRWERSRPAACACSTKTSSGTCAYREATIDAVAKEEQRELERRERLYRDGRPPLDVRGRTVILVDDGLATGSTMRAAMLALRPQHPAAIVVAVPVAAEATCAEFRNEVDDVDMREHARVVPRRRSGVRGLYADDRPGGTRSACARLEAEPGGRAEIT